jgi:PAS domain S-box-containing protein
MQNKSSFITIYSIKGKLIAGFSLLIILLAVLAYMGMHSLSVMNDRLNIIVDVSAEKVKLAARINQGVLAISRAEKNIILSKTQQEMDEYVAFTNEIRDEMKKRHILLRELINDDDKKIVDQFASYWDQYIEVNKEVRALAMLNSNVRAETLSKSIARDAYEEATTAMAFIVDRNNNSLAETQSIDDIRNVAQRITLAARINQNLLEIQRDEKNMILSSTQQEMDGFAKAIQLTNEQLHMRLNLLKNIISDDGRNEFDDFHQAFDKYFAWHEKVRNITRDNGNQQAFNLSNSKGRMLNDRAFDIMSRIVTKTEDDMAKNSRISDENYFTARNLLLIIAGIGLLAGIAIAFYISNNVNSALQRLLSNLEETAKGNGDLTVAIDDSSKDETGDVARAFNIFADMARSKFQGVFNNVNDGMIIIDAKGIIDAFNPAAQTIFGFEKGEVLGKNIKMLMPEPYRSNHDSYLNNHLTTGDKKVIDIGREVSGRCKDGSVFPMDLAVSSMQVSGKPMFVGLVRNITERKQHEKDIKLAKLAAESANHMKSEFLANMSHELRTPLNAIIGYSEMLKEDAEDEGNTQNIDDLNKICTSGNHLLKLINEVLDIAKIEAGQIELLHESFSVLAFLQEITILIQPQMHNNSNRFDIVCAEDIGNIIGDENRLRQVLTNLLSNAAKFTNKGLVTLAVKREDYNGNNHLFFNVSDTGIGMTDEQMDKVFIPFVQADASTTREFGGTGLGLSISKDICELMGGHINVQSEVGQGSKFTVCIPTDLSLLEYQGPNIAMPDYDATTPSIVSYTSGTFMGEGECVLVIDDDDKARDLIVRTLEKDGFSIAAASNGAQGLALAKQLKPLCIILDIMMPGMDGWEMIKVLKNTPEIANIPVIINSIADKLKQADADGAIAYLSKPFQKFELLDLLNELAPEQNDIDILIVEDEEDIRELVARQITSIGWIVRSCKNGLEALIDVQHKMPDVILLDLMMPKMDGFQFLTELRKIPQGNNVPVVIFTAKDLTGQEEILLNQSTKLVIRKGDLKNMNELLPMVRRIMRQPKQMGVQ